MISPSCDLCGCPSNGYECDWPIEGFVTIRGTDLVVGDTVQRVKQARNTSTVARVAFIEEISERGRFVTLAMQTPKSIRRANIRAGLARSPLEFDDEKTTLLNAWKADRFKKFYAAFDHQVRAFRTHACGKRVCDACMVERDPLRMVICAEHWDAWEQAA